VLVKIGAQENEEKLRGWDSKKRKTRDTNAL